MHVGEPLSGVGATALWVAYMRARESERADRLFDDPYAAAFIDATPGWPPAIDESGPVGAAGAAFAWQGAVRTRYLDEVVLAAARDGRRQVVVLGAGLDARAFRLDWPAGTRVFEVDSAAVMAFKENVLTCLGAQPRCDRTVVAADLRDAWPRELARAGLDHRAPTAWLAEGLLVYLSADEVARLLADVTALSAPGSHCCLEYGGIIPAGIDSSVWSVPVVREIASLWQGGLGGATPAALAGHGWRVRTHDLEVVAASYQRPAPVAVAGGFVTATLD